MNYLKYMIACLFIVQTLSLENLTVNSTSTTLGNMNKTNDSVPIVITRTTSRPLVSSSASRMNYFLDNFISYNPR
jgi:hypothetical protein